MAPLRLKRRVVVLPTRIGDLSSSTERTFQTLDSKLNRPERMSISSIQKTRLISRVEPRGNRQQSEKEREQYSFGLAAINRIRIPPNRDANNETRYCPGIGDPRSITPYDDPHSSPGVNARKDEQGETDET